MIRYHVNYGGIPNEIEDLIIFFAYGIKTLELLNDLAVVAFLNTKQMPVPLAWKKLLLFSDDIIPKFNWKAFLKTKHNPYIVETHVSLRNVRLTVERLSWQFLRTQRCLAVTYLVSKYTKKKLLTMLLRGSPMTATLLFLVQRLLCSIEIPRALCSKARMNFHYQNFIIMNPNPLSMFLHAPKLYFS